MSWLYKDKPFKAPLKTTVGFVYIIINLVDYRFYIGKKLFTAAGYKQVKGKRKKIRKPSDWKLYYGSNKYLIEDVKKLGKKNFTRVIIKLCKSRSECSYCETELIFRLGAIVNPMFYNDWTYFRGNRRHTSSFSEETINECLQRSNQFLKEFNATISNK